MENVCRNFGRTTLYSKWDNHYKPSWDYKKQKNGTIRYSAGVLPYTYDQNGVLLFLLGKDHEGDWSDFGGRCEFKDYNDPINTASREFYEETLGAVVSIPDCIQKISNIPEKNIIISKTLNGSPYYMYCMYVDFLNYSDVFNKVHSFVKYQFDNKSSLKIIEKINIRWVTVDTLLTCIDNRDHSTPISLRGVFYKTICDFKEKLVYFQKI